MPNAHGSSLGIGHSLVIRISSFSLSLLAASPANPDNHGPG
jgi:hypothetical protein